MEFTNRSAAAMLKHPAAWPAPRKEGIDMTQYTPNTTEIPYGFCQCGCGQKTTIATKTTSREGWIKGQPKRYISGHNVARGNPVVPWEGLTPLCACGCGKRVALAGITNTKRGYIQGQPRRFCRGHRLHKPAEERFWKHVKKSPDGCWLWIGGTARGGYGEFNAGGLKRGNISSHRFSYELHYGPIPEGMDICHHCDTPACVRPDHLFVGTRSDNVQDMLRKNRHRNGKPKQS
jgi:hypothetical protein